MYMSGHGLAVGESKVAMRNVGKSTRWKLTHKVEDDGRGPNHREGVEVYYCDERLMGIGASCRAIDFDRMR